MPIEKLTDEVFVAREPVVKLDSRNMEFLKNRVRGVDRKQVRLCAHQNVSDTLQEMFLVQTRETYIRPHKHLKRSESFHVMEGQADVLVFSDEGVLTDVIRMGDYASGRLFYYRMHEPFFHSALIRTDYLV